VKLSRQQVGSSVLLAIVPVVLVACPWALLFLK